jgi:hypothetical protein
MPVTRRFVSLKSVLTLQEILYLALIYKVNPDTNIATFLPVNASATSGTPLHTCGF